MMADDHPFTFNVGPHTIRHDCYRWTIFENGNPRRFSGIKYPTRNEAEADALKEMKRLVATWQIGDDKVPQTPA
jgi:hypothetical protein